MEPYYQDASCTIYHADCRLVLPTLEPADLLLTDPPYGIGEARKPNKSRSKLTTSKDYGVAAWDDEPPPEWLIGLMLERARWAVIFGGNYFPLPPASCWLVWDKENGENDFADCELAWTNLKKAVRRKRYRWHGMLQEDQSNRETRVHPTQKPLQVMTWALSQAPEDVQTVLDPFMGSGTTLRAAKDLGKRAIGIEREEKYCEAAAKRLAQETLALGA